MKSQALCSARVWVNCIALLLSFIVLGVTAPSRADDTVFLTSGGRARGSVIEEDRIRGVTIALPNGTFRTFQAAEVARVEYGSHAQAAPAAPQPAAAAPAHVQPRAARRSAQPLAAWSGPATASGLLGSLRVESSEPGQLFIDGAEYGPLPQVVHQLLAGPHRVVVQFQVGDSVTRMVGVRAGEETVSTFESTPSLEAFKVHQGWHFGLGGMLGGALVDGDDGAFIPRVFARASFAATRVVTLRGDFVLGGYGGEYYNSDWNETGTWFGANVRVDLQLNWGSIYTLGLGVDLGLTAHPDEPLVAGVHGSVLGFRFGENRQFLLAAQEGFMLSGDVGVFEQTLELSYLFL